MGKSTFPPNAPELAEPVEEKLIDVLQVEFHAAKKQVKTSLFHLVGEGTGDRIPWGKMHLLLMRIIDQLTQSEKVMDALFRGLGGCRSLLTLVGAYIKHQMKN